MRSLLLFVTLGLTLLFFQNCGDSARSVGLFVDSTSDTTETCQGVECLYDANLLWLRIREYEPYQVSFDVVQQTGYFTVGGQCGVGGFPNHFFQWEFRESFGAQNLIAAGAGEDLCDVGQFQAYIEFGPGVVQSNQRYELTVELVGVTNNFQTVTSSLPSNKASLEVIFVTE